MNVSTAFFLERRIFFGSLTGRLVAVAVIALTLIAGIAGQQSVSRILHAQADFTAEKTAALQDWRATLVEFEETGIAASRSVARPTSINIPAVAPPAPLSDFAAGNLPLYPTMATMGGWTNPAGLFGKYEHANPTLLGVGRFDLTFVVVVLLPLLMIAVSFDALAGERERGRARFVALQSGHVAKTVWPRLLLRNGMILGLFAICTAVLAIMSPAGLPIGERVARAAIWLVVAFIYAGFWFGVIALCVFAIKRSEAVVATLFAAWAVLVLAIPGIGGAVAQGLYPPPSKLEFLSQTRQAEAAALRDTAELRSGFMADHPELSVDEDADVSEFWAIALLGLIEAEKRAAPVLDAFTEVRNRQMQITSAVQYLSPAMIADRALTAVAGGDATRAFAYQDHARTAFNDLRDRISPAVLSNNRISVEEFDAIPEFQFEDRALLETASHMALPVGYMLLISSILMLFVRRRLNAHLENII